MAALIELATAMPVHQNPFLGAFAVWFVLLFSGFLISHVDEARKYPGPGL